MTDTTRTLVAPAGPRRLVLGRYLIESRLGAGGFGTVWRARDERLQREVAVKAVPAGGDDGRRALREAVAAARLGHPAIVALYEAAPAGEHLVLVTELVRGRPLSALLGDGLISDRDALLIGEALCGALAHAHARGVVHRDVKPSNVLVPEVAEPAAAAKLADFGIAHVAGGETITRTGDVVGTLAYMAPEQAAGHPTGPPADVFSLALVLYEALTGTNPQRGTTPAQTARLLARPIAPLAARRPDLPGDVCAAIDRSLHPDPAARPDAAALGAVLAGTLDEVDDVPPIHDRPPAGAGLGVALRLAACLAVVAGLVAAVMLAAQRLGETRDAGTVAILVALALAPTLIAFMRGSLRRLVRGALAYGLLLTVAAVAGLDPALAALAVLAGVGVAAALAGALRPRAGEDALP